MNPNGEGKKRQPDRDRQTDFNKSFGSVLKRDRERIQLSPEQFVEEMGKTTGVIISPSTLRKIEAGLRTASAREYAAFRYVISGNINDEFLQFVAFGLKGDDPLGEAARQADGVHSAMEIARLLVEQSKTRTDEELAAAGFIPESIKVAEAYFERYGGGREPDNKRLFQRFRQTDRIRYSPDEYRASKVLPTTAEIVEGLRKVEEERKNRGEEVDNG